MFDLLKQGDKRWSKIKMGISAATLGAYGCLTTAIAMALQTTPDILAKSFTYNARGELIWNKTNFQKFGAKFVKRAYGFNQSEIEKYIINKGYFVVLEVNNRKHWVLAVGLANNKLAIHDPIDGLYYSSLPSKYKITGYSVFEYSAGVPEYATTQWHKLKSTSQYAKDKNPNDMMSLDDFQHVLQERGKIKNIEPVPWFRGAVILDNLGALD